MHETLDSAPATYLFAIASLALSILSAADVTSALDYFYSPRMIFEFHEYWRFFTPFFYFGDLGIETLLYLLAFVQKAGALESKVFIGKPEDFILFLAFGWAIFIGFGRLLCVPFLSKSLVSYTLYYSAKHFGDERVQIMGLPFHIPMQYTPLVVLALDLVKGGPMVAIATLVAFSAAHVFFFVRDVVGIQYNKSLLRAPIWLQRFAFPLKSQK
jgi:Derlin-2/3